MSPRALSCRADTLKKCVRVRVFKLISRALDNSNLSRLIPWQFLDLLLTEPGLCKAWLVRAWAWVDHPTAGLQLVLGWDLLSGRCLVLHPTRLLSSLA